MKRVLSFFVVSLLLFLVNPTFILVAQEWEAFYLPGGGLAGAFVGNDETPLVIDTDGKVRILDKTNIPTTIGSIPGDPIQVVEFGETMLIAGKRPSGSGFISDQYGNIILNINTSLKMWDVWNNGSILITCDKSREIPLTGESSLVRIAWLDPATGTVTEFGSPILAETASELIHFYGAVRINSNKYLFAATRNNWTGESFNAFFFYDSQTDTWTNSGITSHGIQSASPRAMFWWNNKVWVEGNFYVPNHPFFGQPGKGSNNLACYDPNNDTWTVEYHLVQKNNDFFVNTDGSLHITGLVPSVTSADGTVTQTYGYAIIEMDGSVDFVDTRCLCGNGQHSPILGIDRNTAGDMLYIGALDNIEGNNPIYPASPGAMIRRAKTTNISSPEELGVTVFPNPTSDFVQITGYQEGWTASVLNVHGQLLREFQSERIGMASLPAGIYQLVVSDANGYRFATQVAKLE